MSLDIYFVKKVECEVTVFERNITHNLAQMAKESGLYALWRPEEFNINNAGDLIPILTAGIKNLKEKRGEFERYNPTNRWGNIDTLISAAEATLDAAKKDPDALLVVTR